MKNIKILKRIAKSQNILKVPDIVIQANIRKNIKILQRIEKSQNIFKR